MRSTLILTIALLAAGLAGCLSGDDDSNDAAIEDAELRVPVAPDPEVFLGTVLNDHATNDIGHAGHQATDLHAHGFNLDQVGFDDLSEGLMAPSGGFTELHVVGDLAVVASLTGARGATLVDVSDPADMQVLSHIYNADDNWDARLSADGQYLFLGCQASPAPAG